MMLHIRNKSQKKHSLVPTGNKNEKLISTHSLERSILSTKQAMTELDLWMKIMIN